MIARLSAPLKTKGHSPLPSLRTALYVAFLLAFLIQPVLHHHPLPLGAGGSEPTLGAQELCALCAVGTDQIELTSAAFTAPSLDVHPVFFTLVARPRSAATPATAARAPPSC